MSLRSLRAVRPLLLVALAIGATSGLAACGGGDGEQMSKEQIEDIVNRQAVGQENTVGTSSNSALAEQQVAKDDDARVAAEARERRAELDKIEREQKKERDDVLNGTVEESEEDRAVSLAETRFRSRLAGVCTGAQKRIERVAKSAEKATKTQDPEQLLKIAQEYNAALEDFGKALKKLDAPASQAALYQSWLDTIDDLANNIRLQLVSFADKAEYAKAERRTASLASTFIAQTAQLGVSCLSIT